MRSSAEPAGRQWRGRLEIGFARAVGAPLLRVLGASWRTRREVHPETGARFARGEAVIYALWHGELLPLAYARRGLGIHVLVSRNKDGELIAVVLHALGFRTVRGSTSRGARGALKALVRAGRSGASLAVTPDGPRGPRHRVEDGVLVAAALSGLPIVPIASAASPAWRLRSWDRFLVPAPFARTAVVMGGPLVVPRPATRSLEPWRAHLVTAMTSAGARARELAGTSG